MARRGVLLQAAQLGRVRDAVRRAVHRHAPALAEGLVDVVDLDGPVSQGPPALAAAESRGQAGHSDD